MRTGIEKLIADSASSRQAGYLEGLEAAAAAVEQHDKTGREWIPGSLWDGISREASARIRALKAEVSK